MPTIHELKEQRVTATPLLLFECELASGTLERWSTHRVEYEGQVYGARILRHNLFEMKAGGEEGIDAISKLSVTLANADSHFSQIERNTGWKGGRNVGVGVDFPRGGKVGSDPGFPGHSEKFSIPGGSVGLPPDRSFSSCVFQLSRSQTS